MTLNEEIRKVSYENQTIEYTLVRKAVKNINLRIKAECIVCVSANKRVAVKDIDKFVSSKGEFILNALKRFSQLEKKQPISYENGEIIRFLGNPLYINIAYSMHEEIKNDKENLFLKVKNPQDLMHNESLIKKWLLQQYQVVTDELVKAAYERFKVYNVPYPQIKLREMTSRWGSCNPKKGIVTLNKKLVYEPLPCIEYVVIHEFCHFIHPDHSKRFYDCLQTILPDWKERKMLLQK